MTRHAPLCGCRALSKTQEPDSGGLKPASFAVSDAPLAASFAESAAPLAASFAESAAPLAASFAESAVLVTVVLASAAAAPAAPAAAAGAAAALAAVRRRWNRHRRSPVPGPSSGEATTPR